MEERSVFMAKVSTNITIDSETKAKAQELLADLGLDLSTAVNIFLRQMIRENALPFTIRRDAPAQTAKEDGYENTKK